MFVELWSLILTAYGLFWSLLPCSPPEVLSVHDVNTQQYVGTWYFITAAGSRVSDISQFTSMDSTVFNLQETRENGTLLLTGAIRIGDSCLSRMWIYHLDANKDYLDLEGHPDRRTSLWSGKWLNCPTCVLLLEKDLGHINDNMSRVMLYARNGSLSASVVNDFRSKMSCLGVTEFYSLPQEREYCQHNGTASA
ncbi:apolipoprotein M isoform X2 [Conger conger]|nr:apolipoprotein M isoform X2 [Conger conger]